MLMLKYRIVVNCHEGVRLQKHGQAKQWFRVRVYTCALVLDMDGLLVRLMWQSITWHNLAQPGITWQEHCVARSLTASESSTQGEANCWRLLSNGYAFHAGHYLGVKEFRLSLSHLPVCTS